MDNRPIGLLDSGVGGLTVVKQVIAQMPHESTVFVGDNAHIPYGNKSENEITDLTGESVKFLLSKNVKLIIFACNTATAVALPKIQKQVTLPLIGVVQAGAQAALKVSQNKRVAVVATPMTVKEHAYRQELTRRDPQVEVTELAAPQLVPLIEKNADQASIERAIAATLLPIQAQAFDTLVLGCTHYPIVQDKFVNYVGPGVQVVDPAAQVAQTAYELMQRKQLLSGRPGLGQHEYYTTKASPLVDQLGRLILHEPDFAAQQR
ncbi:glutamate racemase [Lactobacillus xylocopicola]